VHTHPDSSIAGQCAAIIREYPQERLSKQGECCIVCTALVESGCEGAEPGVPTAVHVFGLDTETKCLEWLDEYVFGAKRFVSEFRHSNSRAAAMSRFYSLHSSLL
jgi:hypothetical protein